MGIEWFRDLSITILGFVTSAVLIFTAILVYRLYRTLKSTLLLVKAASKITYDTLALVQDGIKPLLMILALIRDIRGGGFQCFIKKFRKENIEEEGNLAVIQGIRQGFERLIKKFRKENSHGEGNGE